MIKKVCMLFIFCLSINVFAFSNDQECSKYTSNMGDIKLLHNFIKLDFTTLKRNNKLYEIKIQSFNAIRISWENKPNKINIYNFFYNFNTNHIKMYYTIDNSLVKARKLLLWILNDDEYKNDSGIYLAIALSYYLQDKLKYNMIIKYYMNQWEMLGHEIPKNLVKMTNYEDSINIIKSMTTN